MTSGLNRVAGIVHSLAKLPDEGAAPDRELLDQYLIHQDQLAFANLVYRHGDMVLNVCKRILNNYQDAEDALQATFLILASQARSIRQRSLGGWLHTVAYRTAMAARVQRSQRSRFETLMATLPELAAPTTGDLAWRHELDLAIKQLPSRYREALVLCDLGNASRQAAARQLGIPEGTLSSRLNRARTLLARRLRQLGCEPGLLGLTPYWLAPGTGGATKELVSQTSKLAVLMSVHGHLASKSSIAFLAERVRKTMLIAKLKSVVGAAGVLALLAVGGLTYCSASLTAAQESAATSLTRQAKKPPIAEDETKLLQEIIRGHAANRAAMRTLHVKAQMITKADKAEGMFRHKATRFECWQEGENAREIKESSFGGRWENGEFVLGKLDSARADYTQDSVVRPGKIEYLSAYRDWTLNEKQEGHIGVLKEKPADSLQILHTLGFNFNEYGGWGLSEHLEKLGNNKSVKLTVKRTSRAGRALLMVTCQYSRQLGPIVVEFTIDPSQGYLVVVRDIWGGAEEKHRSNYRFEVDKIRECAPGIYFPVHTKLSRKGREETETWVELLEVNQPISADRFVSTIPKDVFTIDHANDPNFYIAR